MTEGCSVSLSQLLQAGLVDTTRDARSVNPASELKD